MVISPKIEQEQSRDKAVSSPDIQNSVYIIPFWKKIFVQPTLIFSLSWVWGVQAVVLVYQVSISAVIKVSLKKSFKFVLEKLYKGLDETLVT